MVATVAPFQVGEVVQAGFPIGIYLAEFAKINFTGLDTGSLFGMQVAAKVDV